MLNPADRSSPNDTVYVPPTLNSAESNPLGATPPTHLLSSEKLPLTGAAHSMANEFLTPTPRTVGKQIAAISKCERDIGVLLCVLGRSGDRDSKTGHKQIGERESSI